MRLLFPLWSISSVRRELRELPYARLVSQSFPDRLEQASLLARKSAKHALQLVSVQDERSQARHFPQHGFHVFRVEIARLNSFKVCACQGLLESHLPSVALLSQVAESSRVA
ncbi:hypothetical protein [Massilia alkalitolerans]|uniref:hypothetical protein n=1 Tax=Massilia alkalitolerans TaxID=286638 RepID=UPI0012ECAD28|nr:hypothetical protein [Massilia alkalitolerans]